MWPTSECVVGWRKDGDTVCFQSVGDAGLLDQGQKSAHGWYLCNEVNDIACWWHHNLVDNVYDTVTGGAVEIDIRTLDGDC